MAADRRSDALSRALEVAENFILADAREEFRRGKDEGMKEQAEWRGGKGNR